MVPTGDRKSGEPYTSATILVAVVIAGILLQPGSSGWQTTWGHRQAISYHSLRRSYHRSALRRSRSALPVPPVARRVSLMFMSCRSPAGAL